VHRESDTHGPRQDDALKRELDGMLRSNGPTRAEEWRDPELPADDDPVLGNDSSTPGGERPENEA
jgi:hypothetical protein